MLRSTSVRGPFVPYDRNPILSQRKLDPARPHPVTSAGHAKFVQTQHGHWWAVFLATLCVDDAELRAEVEALLAAHEVAEGPLERPVAGSAALASRM